VSLKGIKKSGKRKMKKGKTISDEGGQGHSRLRRGRPFQMNEGKAIPDERGEGHSK